MSLLEIPVDQLEVAAVSDRAQQEKLWNISLDLCNDDETRRIANNVLERAQRQRELALA